MTTDRQWLIAALDKAADVIIFDPSKRWPQWLIYLLEVLEGKVDTAEHYEEFLRNLQAAITARLEGGWTMVDIGPLEKALQMEGEITGRLIVDDPHPQIWGELAEAHAYTDKLVQAIEPQRHCSICRTETTGAPLCDRCARHLRRDCQLVHLAIAARACVGSGTIDNLRRDEGLLARYDDASAHHNFTCEEAQCSS